MTTWRSHGVMFLFYVERHSRNPIQPMKNSNNLVRLFVTGIISYGNERQNTFKIK